jgi:hypothetical protein
VQKLLETLQRASISRVVTVQIKGCWHKKTSRKMLNLPRKTGVSPIGGGFSAVSACESRGG